MASLLIRGGTLLTMNDRLEAVDGDVLVRDGRIVSDERQAPTSAAEALRALDRREEVPA